MGAGHSHAKPGAANERRLQLALALTGSFLIVEVAGGILAGSLALISDAAHMLTDTAALAIALAAIRIGRRPVDARRTFGYQRFEILAAAFNAALLLLVAVYILYEAYQRLSRPHELQSVMMLAIATIGLGINFISMRLLSEGSDRSLNIKGAYLEVWSDLVGSAGVILAAAAIYATGWVWIDSVVAVAIGLWVLPRTWVLLRDSVNILLEGVPRDVDLPSVAAAIRDIEGVRSVHDLHVWAITTGSTSLSAHVVVDPTERTDGTVVPVIRAMLHERFGIRHSTIQCEREPCEDADGHHQYI